MVQINGVVSEHFRMKSLNMIKKKQKIYVEEFLIIPYK